MHVTSHVSEEVVPSVFHRIELRFVSQVPFAEYARDVTGGLQGRRQNHLFGRQTQLALVGQPDGIIIATDVTCPDCAFQSTGALLVAPGQKSGAGGTALGAIGIVLRKTHALLGQPINHRRLGLWVTVAPEVTIAHVVNEDQDDIGTGA